MGAIETLINRGLDWVENFFKWIVSDNKSNSNIHIDHFEWQKIYVPNWVRRKSYQFVKRRKHKKYKKMYLRGRHWEYKVYYHSDGKVKTCVRKLRFKNN